MKEDYVTIYLVKLPSSIYKRLYDLRDEKALKEERRVGINEVILSLLERSLDGEVQ